MKVYGHPLSSCTRKVLLTFAEKSCDPEVISIDVFGGEHTRPDHLARHPWAKVPVLEDGSTRLIESRAIIRYLDARLPGPKLTPSHPESAARMDQWLSVDQSYVAPHVATLAGELVLKPHRGLAPDAAVVGRARDALSASFAAIDGGLRSQPYLAGETLSLADLSLMPYVGALALLGSESILEENAALADWWSRTSARPSWRKVAAG